MKRVWLDLDAALLHALLRLTFEQRRELERRLDRAILRARSREEQRRTAILAIRAALGFVPTVRRWEQGPSHRMVPPAAVSVGLPAPFAKLREENLRRSEYWARVAERARAEIEKTSTTRQDRRVSHL